MWMLAAQDVAVGAFLNRIAYAKNLPYLLREAQRDPGLRVLVYFHERRPYELQLVSASRFDHIDDDMLQNLMHRPVERGYARVVMIDEQSQTICTCDLPPPDLRSEVYPCFHTSKQLLS